MLRLETAIVGLAIAISPVFSVASQCTAESGRQRVALLELYTSEGCNSCPPTDRWVSGLPGRGFTHGRVVTLAFHVDYWNYLGWADSFSKAQYSERQRAASARSRSRVVYTPQLLLNGKDYRRGSFFDSFGEHIDAIGREPAQAKIRVKLQTGDERGLLASAAVLVSDAKARREAQGFLALYENNLTNQVTAGENRGESLRHDFVVRELAGPFPVNGGGEADFTHRFRIQPGWKKRDLHVTAFVQNDRTGDVLQALALPHCP